MKKLLSLLSILAIGGVSTSSIVACSNRDNHDKKPKNPSDQSKLPFIYHIVQNTNLGTVDSDNNGNAIDKSILSSLSQKNNNLDTNGLTVSDKTDKSAIINVDKYNTHFKRGTLKVTFNTVTSSNDLNDLITVNNIYANRNIDRSDMMPVPTQINPQDVLDGVNAANGLDLKLADVIITFSGQRSGKDHTPTIATIAHSNTKYQGKINVTLNQELDLSQTFSNTDLGTIYLPQTDIDLLKKKDLHITSSAAFLMEYIGDANPLLAEYSDVIASLQLYYLETNLPALSVNLHQLVLDANISPSDNPLALYFTKKVAFTYNIEVDHRLAIGDAIKITDLETIDNPDMATIKTAIIKKNQDQLSIFSEQDLDRYLIVSAIKNNSATVSWLPGSKQFLGHDALAVGVQPDGTIIPELTTTVSWNK